MKKFRRVSKADEDDALDLEEAMRLLDIGRTSAHAERVRRPRYGFDFNAPYHVFEIKMAVPTALELQTI